MVYNRNNQNPAIALDYNNMDYDTISLTSYPVLLGASTLVITDITVTLLQSVFKKLVCKVGQN